MPDVGVLALVPSHWSEYWQPRQHVLSRLARYFRVVWASPAPYWRSALSERQSRKDRVDAVRHAPELMIYEPPLWLPTFYRPRWLAEVTSRARLQQASKLLRDRGCRKIILYLWRPEFAETLTQVSFDLSIYHIDDEYSFSPADLPTPEVEARLIRDVNQVFIHSLTLMDKKGGINPHSMLVPNGADFRLYTTPAPQPLDLARIPRPRIGYSGFIKKNLDWRLLDELSLRHPDWSFVFIGKSSDHRELASIVPILEQHPNVFFLGSKPWKELASYTQHLDVCIMPYLNDGYTKYIFPLKLNEYLASGRPIVATPIPVLASYDHVLALASTTEEWSAAIQRALSPAENESSRRAQRQALARQSDWDYLVWTIARKMAEHLGPSYLQLVEEARPAVEQFANGASATG